MSKAPRSRLAKLLLHDEVRITAGHAHHRAPAWSADGRMLAFCVGTQDAAWVLTDRRGRVARSLEGPAAGKASFGPDGELAFQRVFGTTSEIWLTPGGDAPPVRLLGGDAYLYRDPAISPDGRVLACAVADDPDSRFRLVLIHLDTGQRVELPAVAKRSDGNPLWEGSGESLLFEGAEGHDRAIYRLHLTDHHAQRLTPETEVARRPASLGPGLFLYERVGADDRIELVVGDFSSKDSGLQTHPLRTEHEDRLRCDPVVHLGKAGKGGKARVAFAAIKNGADTGGEPPRFDVFVAQLSGLAR